MLLSGFEEKKKIYSFYLIRSENKWVSFSSLACIHLILKRRLLLSWDYWTVQQVVSVPKKERNTSMNELAKTSKNRNSNFLLTENEGLYWKRCRTDVWSVLARQRSDILSIQTEQARLISSLLKPTPKPCETTGRNPHFASSSYLHKDEKRSAP